MSKIQSLLEKKEVVIALKYIIFAFIFYSVWIGLVTFFHEFDNLIAIFISSICAVFFSPNIKEVDNQSGKHLQVKWIFLKKPFQIKLN